MVHKLWMFHIYVNDSRVSIFNGWSSLIIQMTIKVIMTSQTCGSVHRSYLSHHCHVGPGKKHQLDHQPYCSNWCVPALCLPMFTLNNLIDFLFLLSCCCRCRCCCCWKISWMNPSTLGCLDLVIALQRCFHVIFGDAHLPWGFTSKTLGQYGTFRHSVGFNMLQTNTQMDKNG